MATINKEYLAKLLVHGVSQVQAAAACGCTQGYIAQLISDDKELTDAIEIAETGLVEKKIKTDESLEGLETRLIGKAGEMIDYAETLGETVNALHKVAHIRERSQLRSSGSNSSGNVIELNLGEVAATRVQVVVDSRSTIISIGDRNMIRAPASSVKDMIKERRERVKALPAEVGYESEEGYEDFADCAVPDILFASSSE